jgi:hypothetical protein
MADFPNLYSEKTHTAKGHTKMRLMILDKAEELCLEINTNKPLPKRKDSFFLFVFFQEVCD